MSKLFSKLLCTLVVTLFDSVAMSATELVNGVALTYTISNGKAMVGDNNGPAIPTSTDGDFVIPATLGNCPVTTIANSAFDGCSRLKSIKLPVGVTAIGIWAFWGCSGLTDLTIPDGVTTIWDGAFEGCTRLVTVVIPKSVSSINTGAFYNCSSLTTVYVASGDANRIARLYPFEKSVNFVELNPPSDVVASDGLYEDRVRISWSAAIDSTSYNIYRSTTTSHPVSPIQNGVVSPYNDTTAIPGVVYYYWVEAVNAGGLSISSCDSGYRAVSLSLGKSADSLTSSGGSGNVTVSANTVWVATSDVDWIKFDTPSGSGNGVLTYSVDAVLVAASRTGTITVTAGANTEHPLTKALTVTQYAANAAPTALGEVTASDGVHDDCVSISWASAVGATSYNVYRSTTTSRPASPMAQDVVSPYNDTTAIPGVKYYYWIEAANSAGSVVSSYDAGYRSVSLSLGSATCSCSLSGGKYGASVTANTSWAATTDADWIAIEPQSDDGRLSFLVAANTTLKSRSCEITVTAGMGTCDPVSKTIQVSQNFDFVVVKGVLTQYTGGGGAIVIPSGVTSIGDYAFMDRTSLGSVIIPEGVTNIGDYAFCGCKYLNSVWMPESLMRIGTSAFGDCRALTAVTIPSGVMEIGDGAFGSCAKLTSGTIPPGVTRIWANTFADCKSLTSITIPRSVTSILQNAFWQSGLKTVYVASGDASRVAKLYDFGSTVKFEGLREIEASDGTRGDCVRITWRGAGDGTTNRIYRSTTAEIPNSPIESGVTLPFNDTTAIPGIKYYYWVKRTNSSVASLYDTGYRAVTLSLGSLSDGYEESGGEGSTMVAANTDWNASADVDWITLGEQSGSGDGVLTYTVLANTSQTARKGTITVVSGKATTHSVSARITVMQEGPPFQIEDGVLKRYRGSQSSVVIPDGVTSIGENAFSGCVGLTSVVIPAGVKSIGNWAFSDCRELISVDMPEGMTDVGHGAFRCCERLSSATIPLALQCIGDWAFSCCSGLVGSVTIPAGVKRIGGGAFEGCSGLVAVNISEGVEEIGDEAFRYCSGLTSVEIPTSVTGIGSHAFYNCSDLKSVSIPANVTRIGGLAFAGCDKLTFVAVPACVTKIADVFPYHRGITTVVIQDGVTSVAEGMFDDCDGLVSVTIPSSVTRIGDFAFSGCSKVLSIQLPEDLTSIGVRAFYGCCGLSSMSIPGGVKDIGKEAFLGCSGLSAISVPACNLKVRETFPDSYEKIKEITICEGTPQISDAAFYGCSGLRMIRIPEGVTNIGDHAFSECSALTSVAIPRGVMSIGDSAFSLSGLTSVNIPDGVTRIGSEAFMACHGLKSVLMPSSITCIGNSAFSFCDGLATIKIPESVTNIGESAFYQCSALTSLTIPGSVDGVGFSAFGECRGLTTVGILEGVKSVGDFAFSGCDNLNCVRIASSVTSIDSHAFEYCRGILWATVPECVLSDVFPHSYKTITEVAVCDGTKTIKDGMFEDCIGMEEVSIPQGVTTIGDSAFLRCRALRGVRIPLGVESIGNYAFGGCSAMTSVVIPSSVSSVGAYAFSTCSGLTDVTISDGVTSIGEGAFVCCTGLSSMTIPASVTSMGKEVFSGCTGLSSVTICSGVKSIESGSFRDCCRLTTMIIPPSVSDIGSRAFEGCSALESITVSPSLKVIKERAFYACTSLNQVKVYAGDRDRLKGLYSWANGVQFVEIGLPVIEGDEGATVTGDVETGFVIKPSVGNTAVEVTIPQGVDAAKVTVEVSAKVATVKPNGAKVKVVVGENDITSCLVIPESDGVMNIAAAMVKDEIVKETLDPSKDAVIELDAANPRLITAPTRKGLTYTLFEGHELKSLSKGDTKLGDGNPWTPKVTVSGADAAFYLIDVSK